MSLWVLLAWLCGPDPLMGQALPAETAQGQEIQAWAQDAARLGKRPEGVVPLLQMGQAFARHDGAAVRAALASLVKDSRLGPPQQVLVKRLLASSMRHLGEPAAAAELVEGLGYITTFRVIGPFDNEGKAGLDATFEPERDRMMAPDLDSQFPGKLRPVMWRSLPQQITRHGLVPLSYLLSPRENTCALAETFVHSPEANQWTLWFGAGGGSKLYWNGAQVAHDATYRERAFPDRAAVPVTAHKGWNRLLVKVCVSDEDLGFYLRIGDREGKPLAGLQLAENTPEALNIKSARSGASQAVTLAPLAALEQAYERARGPMRLRAAVTLARYLRLTGSDDAAVHRARQLAAEAAQAAAAQVEWLLLAAELSDERAEKMRFVHLAAKRSPQAPAVLFALAKLRASGPAQEDALPYLEAIPEGTLVHLRGQLLRAKVLREAGLAGAAYRIVEEAQRNWGARPIVLRALADAANASSHADQAVSARRLLLQVLYDDLPARRVLISDALHRNDTAAASEHLDVLRDLFPGNPGVLRYVARSYDALGRDDLALATYTQAMEYLPESPSLRFAYARAVLKAEQVALAQAALQEVLRLSPQHAGARELLEHLQPAARRDETFAVAADTFLQRRQDGGGHSTTVLQRLQVNTVFDNGLGTRFTQWVTQAHDEQGARELRAHSIQFDPETQRVDLRLARVYRADGRRLESIRVFERQLGEPWYRIYYDTRALTVVFPDLQPGDVVELRYRVDDIAQRNRFADYFGDMHFFADDSPTVHHEYVLVTPTRRTFYVHPPQLEGLEYEQKVEGERRIQRWVASDVPALVEESDMPGLSEVSPYLHVSTYKTWEDVGRWYWGLIHGQLYADRGLKRTVAELVAGATTTEEKVRRIHNWVIEHTRYVGLEFGIHGFLPYRVPLIVQRGFGDCKDKASLLYTMFKEAGVDARITLVRTRRNGRIEDLPASLAIFDHAIAYVPELDLYIDGTAEHSGMRELPVQDQGVTVLVVGPEGAELAQTPVLGPDSHARRRMLEVELVDDGSAVVRGTEEVEGTEAAAYRAYYEAPATREERWLRSMAGQYPGLTLNSLHFSDLQDVSAPVTYRYEIRVPRLAEKHGAGTLEVAPSAQQDLVRRLARIPERLHPLDLQTQSAYVETRTLRAPKGFTPQTLPVGGEVKSAFFELSLDIAVQEQSVVATTRFRITVDRIATADYAEFRKSIQEADRLLRQRIGFGKVQP